MSVWKAKQKHPPKPYEGLRSFLWAVVIALVFRSLAYEPFHIPSGSMLNTLQIGDYLFINKFSYGYSRYSFPFSPNLFGGERIFETMPKRGDVVVFRLPTDTSIDYIKRVIGLPGDTIQVKNGVVWINGAPVSLKRTKDATFIDDYGNVRTVAQFNETLPNGFTHPVLDETKLGIADFTKEYKVPKGHLFMMGDNRDNSIDSRFLQKAGFLYPQDFAGVGFVPVENLIGRAERIGFSFKPNASFFKFWEWGDAFRHDRWFKALNNPSDAE